MRLRLAVSLTAALAASVTAPATAAAAPPPPCESLAFSPSFTRDRTVFCAFDVAGDAAYLARSTNGGRTWGPRRQIVSGSSKHFSPAVQVSPWYAKDRRVLATTSAGLFESTDSGVTFRRVDDGTDSPPYAPRIAPYTDTLPDPTKPHGAFAYGVAGGQARVYDPVAGARTVLGAGNNATLRFLVPPDYAQHRQAVALAKPPVGVYQYDQPVLEFGLGAYACAGDFVCPHRSFYFGDVALAHSAPLARPGSLGVVTRDNPHSAAPVTMHAWRTADYGRSWLAWPSVDRLIDSIPKSANYDVEFTGAADAPRRLFLHLTTWTDGPDVRSDFDDPTTLTLYRSDDDGATWHRVGTSTNRSLPWNHRTWWAPVTLTAVPGGLLYATAAHRTGKRIDYRGVFCSRDAGRSWRRGGC